MGQNIININGRQIVTNGGSISINNNRIFIDGKEYTDDITIVNNEIRVIIEGTVENLEVGGSLELIGDVKGSVDVKGNFTGKSVGGDLDVRGNVSCGNIEGSVSASGNVICGKVTGNASARGNLISNG